MSGKHPSRKQPENQKRAAMYLVDTQPGAHSYAFVEGVGECRKNFMDMVEGLEKGEVDVVVVAGAKLLYVDTSPMWMEKFISTVKRHGILIADAKENKEYNLRKPADEAAFRALRTR